MIQMMLANLIDASGVVETYSHPAASAVLVNAAAFVGRSPPSTPVAASASVIVSPGLASFGLPLAIPSIIAYLSPKTRESEIAA